MQILILWPKDHKIEYDRLYIHIAENTRSALDRPPLFGQSLFYNLSSNGPNRAEALSGHKLHLLPLIRLYYQQDINLCLKSIVIKVC